MKKQLVCFQHRPLPPQLQNIKSQQLVILEFQTQTAFYLGFFSCTATINHEQRYLVMKVEKIPPMMHVLVLLYDISKF